MASNNESAGAAPDPEPRLSPNAEQGVSHPQMDTANRKADLRAEADAENERLISSFDAIKAQYENKRAVGSIDVNEELTFLRLESAEMSRRRKFADERANSPQSSMGDEKEDEEDGQGLFVQSDEDVGDPGPGEKKKRKNAKRTGGAKKRPRMEDDIVVLDADDEENGVQTVQRKRPRSKVPKNGDGAAKAKAKKLKRNKAQIGHEITNLASLQGTNIFREAEVAADYQAQPEFANSTRRADALKQLVASVPTDSRKHAHTDRSLLQKALKSFNGQGSVKPHDNSTWLVSGMKTGLKPYQVIGGAFLRDREKGEQLPLGGILADEMGLGKTIEMLANIINGRDPSERSDQITLVVSTPALCEQWEAEIRAHCMRALEGTNGLRSIIQYRAPGARALTRENLLGNEIVLTTYSEVARSYPMEAPPACLTTWEEKDQWWKAHYELNRGDLHRITFHRVVLDEAHAIKNHQTRVSVACRALEAKHRWAMSGTPIQNGLKEFYPYFKFLRMPNTGDFKLFKQNFIAPEDPDGVARLNALLSQIMVRRTHVSRFMNARLVDLPKPNEETHWLEFNPVERQVYEIVKLRFIRRINRLCKEKGTKRTASDIYSMILRLRQLTSHILLVQDTLLRLLEREDYIKLNELTEQFTNSEEQGAMLLSLRRVLVQAEVRRLKGEVPDNGPLSEETLPMDDPCDIDDDTGGAFGKKFMFKKYMDTIKKNKKVHAEIAARAECAACHNNPDEPWSTSCGHIYCRQCLTDLQEQSALSGEDGAKCVECMVKFTHATMCEPVEQPLVSEGGENGKKNGGQKDEPDIENWIDMSGQICPSAKTNMVKIQVIKWLKEEPSVKIIIFTQFLPIVRILERLCKSEKWGYCVYTGKQTHDRRVKEIQSFHDDLSKKILLASLKAGGQGLNLTCASRIITLDLWWNSAVEQQGFCRVYRIGQTKETYMSRLIVRNTIDEAMLAVMKRKDAEIAKVMDESVRGQPLTVEEMMRLFGEVREDEEGHPFIFPNEGAGGDFSGGPRFMANDGDEDAMMGNSA